MNRPLTTLFLLQSLDGKISTGDVDERDVDKDFSKIEGVKEGLHQYYELEQKTDLVSFNTGRVQAKVGANDKDLSQVEKTEVSFIIVDNQPHLNKNGSEYFAKKSKTFYLITNNKNHPAFGLKPSYDNVQVLLYEEDIDFVDAFSKLKEQYGIEKMTIQTGGILNATLLRNNLIDRVSVVIAPALIGGKNTPTLVDGASLRTVEDLTKIKPLKLIKNEALKDNYLHLQYEVVK